MFVTVEERGEAGTVVHDKSAALCALRGGGAVGQQELGDGSSCRGHGHYTILLRLNTVTYPGLLGSVELCLASQI